MAFPLIPWACCKRRLLAFTTLAVVACSTAAAPRPTTDALHDFEASGPVRVAFDQVVSVCATNYGPTAHGMLLAVVNATADVNQPGVLASKQVQMAPFASACIDLPAANWQPLYGPQASVIGFGVDSGFVDQGVIRQGSGGIGGGGCIVSVQILDAAGKTVLFAPTRRHQIP